MHATEKYLHYSVKGTLEVCEYYDMAIRKRKYLSNTEEEQDLKTRKTIYIEISFQKKPRYGVSNNWILIQDSDTKQKSSFFTKAKAYLTEKITLS